MDSHRRASPSERFLLALALLPAAAGAPLAAQLQPGEPQRFLDAHHAVRADALPTPIPPLPPMAWNATLATSAQAWASGCTYQHSPAAIGGSVGENLYARSPTRGTPEDVVALWASEGLYYDYASNTCSGSPFGTCGHYTQLVWQTATQVGCGMAMCSAATSPFPSSEDPWALWVCQYQTGQTSSRPYACDYDGDGSRTQLCDARGIFADGFESGNTVAWDGAVP